MKRYEILADELAAAIATGALPAGSRLPSVRAASIARGVSASTVFEAYYLLEARGLVRPRDRSGYYVLPRAARVPEPGLSRPAPGPTKVDVSDLVFDVLRATRQRDVVPFGSAFPSPLLFPWDQLGTALGRSARSVDPWRTVDDIGQGNVDLRTQIARRYALAGVALGADDLVITNGALEALNLCLGAVTRSGDAVVIESPCFYAALQAIERLDLRAVSVPTDPREGIDLAALERALHEEKPRACWVMSSFQNPLGSSMPTAKKRALVALLARHEVPLIEDDVYGELHFDRVRPPPAKAFDSAGLVLTCSSFSKTLAPGYRIGWAAPGRFAERVLRLKLTTSLSSAVPIQAALAAYLERGAYDRHLRHLRQSLAAQQASMLAAVQKHLPKGTRATRPEGGYFVWVELPDDVDALKLHRLALAEGISIAPGPMFSARRGFTHCVRLNYGHPWDLRAERAMATLGRLARSAHARAASGDAS